jgi:hypothetical protein
VNLEKPFQYYGKDYSTVFVSTKGFVTFGGGSFSWVNYPLPSAQSPANMIAAFHDDLSTIGQGEIFLKQEPDRVIIQWEKMTHYNYPTSFTFQMHLNQNGSVHFYYKQLEGDLNTNTIGMQNQSRDTGFTIAYNTPYVHDNLAIQISPLPNWLEIHPQIGAVAPGEAQKVQFHFYADGLALGEYETEAFLEHNTWNTPSPFLLPIHLSVIGLRIGGGRILTSHQSVTPWLSGQSYRIRSLQAGSATAGLVQGNQYRLILK